MKENRIPMGKKKSSVNKLTNDKIKILLDGDYDNQIISKKRQTKTYKKNNKQNEQPLQSLDINLELINTSLTKKIELPKPKLSTITEFEEKISTKNEVKIKKRSGKSSNTNKIMPVKNEKIIEQETKLISDPIDDLNNTVENMKATVSEAPVVLSPFVCTTRGQKWKPSPRKPPKLSELFEKYEDNNVADIYRKKLDDKTVELQQKVKYWTEFSSENNNIPDSFKDEIDVVCGQTKLLTTDKFMQMRSLIEEFDNKSGSMPIKTADLDGFWDMLLLQVEKLEKQFKQLITMKENNWIPFQPVAKKTIKKYDKNERVLQVKSKITEFLKNQRIKSKTIPKKEMTESQSHFHEMKSSNNTCLISSTPTSSNQKNISFTPVLLKTLELSYVARRSGMTPIVLAKPHISPLKPALKKSDQEKGVKRRNIHFESPKKINDDFVTPQNSFNCDDNEDILKHVQSRVATPHNIQKTNNIPNKKNSSAASLRRSSRLASKPLKNYKV
ncbi:guanylate kinase-associated protein mars isoform X2 [Daktulosphaira vitifoliae]|nr:guanylate kinase-associated protein mars isoform X2 [Daktulosphaira vitifoliae]